MNKDGSQVWRLSSLSLSPVPSHKVLLVPLASSYGNQGDHCTSVTSADRDSEVERSGI